MSNSLQMARKGRRREAAISTKRGGLKKGKIPPYHNGKESLVSPTKSWKRKKKEGTLPLLLLSAACRLLLAL